MPGQSATDAYLPEHKAARHGEPKMSKTKKALVMILAASALILGGCKKEQNEDLNVLNHDFTEQEWSDFYDEKMARQEKEMSEASSGEGSGSVSGQESDNRDVGRAIEDQGSDGPDTEDQETGSKKVVIMIDPGHGGKFPGAESGGVREKTLTLKTAGYLKKYLTENYENVECFLTREDDKELDNDLVKDLENRAKAAADVRADALVSIHFNASDDHNRNGCYIYISRRDNVSRQCASLARYIMNELKELGIKENAIEQRKSNDMFDEKGEAYDYYAINRHCAARGIPGIIVEQCFMDSKDDAKYMDTDEALRKLGEADARGIALYFGLKEKEN